MIKQAVILAGGQGSRVWPYGEIRNKAMIPVSNTPVVDFNIQFLLKHGVEKVVIMAHKFPEQISAYYKNNDHVQVVAVDQTNGSAKTLLAAKDYLEEKRFLALYADTVMDEQAIVDLLKTESGVNVLIADLDKEPAKNWITCAIDKDKQVLSYIRTFEEGSNAFYMGGYAFDYGVFKDLVHTPHVFSEVSIGMMPKAEYYLEILIQQYLIDRVAVQYTKAEHFVDIDKPWHILVANEMINIYRTQRLTENILAKGAKIHENATIEGFVQLGENSYIGDGCKIKGNIIVGDNTVIDNGAIVEDGVVIGDNASVKNYCLVSSPSSIGDRCIIDHCSEVWCSVIMNNAYLYHYGEFMGIVGESTDIGAATVCGTLRFDNDTRVHRINGRKEKPSDYGSGAFLGDFSRTGVNAILMPGVKTGIYSVVGSGLILYEDLEDNTCALVEQNVKKIPWGPNRYGW